MVLPYVPKGQTPAVRPLSNAAPRTPSTPHWMAPPSAQNDEPGPPVYDPQLIQQMQAGLRSLSEASHNPHDPAELVELAMVVARSVIDSELQTSPGLLRQRVDAAIEHLATQEEKRVRMNASLAQQLGEPPRGVTFVIDETLSPGALLVETAVRTLDLSWEGHLQRFEAELRRALHEEKAA